MPLLAATVLAACGPKSFERVETTENGRYSIVRDSGKYGVYDNFADSLVTQLVYDRLAYSHAITIDSIEITVWTCIQDECSGVISIAGENNETMSLVFSKE